MTTTEKKTGKYYTGVGSRETPAEILKLIKRIACKLAEEGYHLRSGAADGADTAFEEGFFDWLISTNGEGPALASIYIPWAGFNSTKGVSYPEGVLKIGGSLAARLIAEEVHPAWDKCSQGAKALHTRNVSQVLGDDLTTPSSFLICWAPPTKTGVKGGTNTAWQLAKRYNIPCFNLAVQEDRERVERWLGM